MLLNIFQIFLCFVNFCLKLGFITCVAVSPNFGNECVFMEYLGAV